MPTHIDYAIDEVLELVLKDKKCGKKYDNDRTGR